MTISLAMATCGQVCWIARADRRANATDQRRCRSLPSRIDAVAVDLSAVDGPAQAEEEELADPDGVAVVAPHRGEWSNATHVGIFISVFP